MSGRYMPQDVFNITVVVGAMALLTGKPETMDSTIASYRAMYPNETDRLKPDVMECGKSVREFVEGFWSDPGGMSVDEKLQYHFQSLTMLYKELQKRKDDGRPFWRRILGGARFNYSSAPIPERGYVAFRTVTLLMLELEQKAVMG
jgi:hypothetical protein